MKQEVWNELLATLHYGLNVNFFTAFVDGGGEGVRNYNVKGGCGRESCKILYR